MKKILFFFIFLILSFPAYSKVSSKDINFPKHFYTNQIKNCPFVGHETFKTFNTKSRIESLIKIDWMDEWSKGNSRTVNHENLTGPMTLFAVATHNAIGDNDISGINSAKQALVNMAKAEVLSDTISYKELKKKPLCWLNGDPESPCWFHAFEFARDAFTNYLIIAIYLKEYLSDEEYKIVNQYVKKMHSKLIKPQAFYKQEKGFYAMGNGGIPNLVYANWTDDKKLAAKEFNFRFVDIDRLFYDDGYINNNSFRGYRALWYHSYGLNSALGYVYLAKLWNVEVPKKIIEKVTKASEVLNLGIIDYDKFSSRKYSGDQTNNQYKIENARKHTHQDALAIDTLMKKVTGIKLENDTIYLMKRPKYGIDDLIGFNPNCI